jgi:hypothetical protein
MSIEQRIKRLGELKSDDEIVRKLNLEVQKRPAIANLFSYLKDADIDFKTVINRNTWTSKLGRDTHSVDLGIQPIPQHIKEKALFLEHKFSDEDTIIYRYLHELSHALYQHFASKVDFVDLNQDFLEFAQKMNDENGYNLSTLPSLPAYHQDGLTGALEDIAELLAMRLYSEEYFNQYMEMLQKDTSNKRELKLHTLNKQETEFVKSYVEKFIDLASKAKYTRPQKLTRIY